jgi:hypothetical protein
VAVAFNGSVTSTSSALGITRMTTEISLSVDVMISKFYVKK